MSVQEDILHKTIDLIERYGIKSITMDDIANHLGISKKTIYQYYKDKNSLILECVKGRLSSEKCYWKELHQNSRDVIEELFKATEHMRNMARRMNPSLIFELRKYHAEAYKEFVAFKKNFVVEMISESLIRGIKQGYFRNDINVEILAKMRVEQIELAFNPEVFQPDKYDFAEVNVQFLEHFIYGISTLKGHTKLNQLRNITEN